MSKPRVQTPDDIDRNDQYIPLVDIDRRWAMWLSVVATAGFTGGLLLLWWFSQP